MSFEVHDEMKLNGNKLTGLPTPTTAETTAAANVQFVLDNAGGAPTASNVSFTPDADTFPEGTDNVDEALKALFTSANSGKGLIAGAIGDPAESSDTFAQLAGYVTTAKEALDAFIDSAEGTTDGSETLAQLTEKLSDVRIFKQKVNLKKAAGSVTTIPLASPPPSLEKLVVTPFVRTNDTATTNVVASFNNGEKDDFFDNDYVEFDGVAKLKNNYTYDADDIGSGINEWTINASQFEEFKDLSINGTTLSLVARPKPQVLEARDDIPLDNNVLDVTRIQYFVTLDSFTNCKYAVSFDSGARWFVNPTNSLGGWVEIDIYDTATFLADGIFRTLNIDLIDELRNLSGNNPATVKFAYILQGDTYQLKARLDRMEIDVVMSGSFVPYSYAGAPANTYTYDALNGIVTVNHSQNDAYIINYIDKP